MSGFDDTTYYFRQVAKVMKLSHRVQLRLINPDKEITVEIANELDNGQLGSFRATASSTMQPAGRHRHDSDRHHRTAVDE